VTTQDILEADNKKNSIPSINRWIRNIWYTSTIESFKKKEILSFVTNLEDIVLSERI
jgi:hypothetical protein